MRYSKRVPRVSQVPQVSQGENKKQARGTRDTFDTRDTSSIWGIDKKIKLCFDRYIHEIAARKNIKSQKSNLKD